MMKIRKIGSSTITDSFTPRKFMTTSTIMARMATSIFRVAQCCGNMLNSASTPLMIDTEMVST